MLPTDLTEADSVYAGLSPEERLKKLFEDFNPEDVLLTSSFGSSSAVLLHLISRVRPQHPIHFIDTTFHFDETLAYKDTLIRQFNLNVVDVSARANRNKFTHENHTWQLNPDLCCFINKVEPLSQIKKKHKVWVSGLMAHQNANRQNLTLFQQKEEIIKFHPLLDMSAQSVALYQMIYELPPHPLTRRGYQSVGCTYCTKQGEGRSGRWAEITKTECGLHT
jgi:phosphoadenosine phosphosulfate reductase